MRQWILRSHRSGFMQRLERLTVAENETGAGQPVSVYDVIIAMVDTMASMAWQKLGLQPDMATGRLEMQLDEAKVAIDLTAHLASFIEPKLDTEDSRRIHRLVDDLKINYVNKQKEAKG